MTSASSVIVITLSGVCLIVTCLWKSEHLSEGRNKGSLDSVISTQYNPFVLQSSSLPGDSRFHATITNGFVGHAIYSEDIYLNGLYNGEKGDSHRARIPSTLPYIDTENLTIDNSSSSVIIPFTLTSLYALDMLSGTYSQTFGVISSISKTNLCNITQLFYAHRYLTRLLVTQIFIKCVPNILLSIPLHSSDRNNSSDITFSASKEISIDNREFLFRCGHTNTPEQPDLYTLNICYSTSNFPPHLVVNSNYEKQYFNFTYITSISNDENDVIKFVSLANKYMEAEILLHAHKEEWRKSWEDGSIQIESHSQRVDSSVLSGLYYLASAFPPRSFNEFPYQFFGASPGGLTNGQKDQCYLGHVFWDQDFWMLPALLPLYPHLVEHGLKYRIARLKSAIEKAQSHGFDGAFYPWESAYSGLDVCPGEVYIDFEQHVTGDIIHVLRQYVYLTGNYAFMHENIPAFPSSLETTSHTAWNMTYETAKFWLSRTVYNIDTNLYEIHNVMGPDEYHPCVNNSAFTNAIALQNLQFALEMAVKLKIDFPEKYRMSHVANHMFVPFDKVENYHPEFDGYRAYYDVIKQADTIMLGFPLGYNMSADSWDNDLNLYSYVTDPSGPAMTWSMFSINYNERGELVAADEYFLKQFDNIQPPFQIWSESPGGYGAVNFLTGMGGYLQNIIYGFFQLRIHDSFITLKPRLPPTLTGDIIRQMSINGLKVRGVSIDVYVATDVYSITLANINNKNDFVQVIGEGKYKCLRKNSDSMSLPIFTSSRIAVIQK